MIHIDNLKEKELLIAHYFSENTKKELNPHEVFDMWSNWFIVNLRRIKMKKSVINTIMHSRIFTSGYTIRL